MQRNDAYGIIRHRTVPYDAHAATHVVLQINICEIMTDDDDACDIILLLLDISVLLKKLFAEIGAFGCMTF